MSNIASGRICDRLCWLQNLKIWACNYIFSSCDGRQFVNCSHFLHLIACVQMKVKNKVSFSDIGSTKNYGVPVYKLYEPFLVSA
jgi:hypothetical protein